MSRRKPKKPQKNLHYFVALQDRPSWGNTVCEENGPGTSDWTKVTCKPCRRHITWTVAKYDRACKDPLFLCPTCDAGQLFVHERRRTQRLMICNACTFTKWQDLQLIT